MDIRQRGEHPVGFLSLRLEQTEVGFVATITANPNIADRLGDRVHRLTDPEAIHHFTQIFVTQWLSNNDPVTRR